MSFHPCDIRQEEAVKTIVTAIVVAQGRIDGMGHSGAAPAPAIEKLSASELLQK